MPPPDQPSAPPAPELAQLAAVVARLERELAALQRRTITVSPASHLRLTPTPTGYIVEDMKPR